MTLKKLKQQVLSPDLSSQEFPETYKVIVNQMTTFLGVSCLGATVVFFTNWQNPNWNAPWSLLVWFAFVVFNLAWTFLINSMKSVARYELIRIWVNYGFIIAIFFATGGAAENFWFPAVVCTLGSATTLYLATDRFAVIAMFNLILYVILFVADSGNYTDSEELVLIGLIIIPIFATSAKVARVVQTQLRQLEHKRELLDAAEVRREQALAAEHKKTLFLANMNHEIRTPLSAIVGYSDLLTVEDNDVQDQKKYLKVISRNSQHLQCLISDVLDLAKIESGKAEVNKVTVNLHDEVNSALDTARPVATANEIFLESIFHPGLPETIETDPTRLRQILSNIIGNAIKFTDEGSVNVEVSCDKVKGDGILPARNVVRILVQDTGCGIPREMQEKIFEEFIRVRNSGLVQKQGTGLGLALSHRLTSSLGGHLRLLDSREGQGSTFEITIPSDPSARQPDDLGSAQDSMDDVSLENVNILLVEDSEDQQFLMCRFLDGQGCRIFQAYNGVEALELIRQQQIDLMLLDLEMPLLDGYDTLIKVREMGSHMPVVACSAHAIKEVRKRALNMGFEDFATKPLSRQQLINILKRNYRKVRPS